MYLDGKYMPICSFYVTEQALNSGCRQLGYTNALTTNSIAG